jgi:hypothetical protein
MAARKVNTPGATEKAPEPVSTAEQADALVPVEQLDAVAQKLAEAEAKIKALEAQSKATVKTAAPAQPFQSQAAEVKRTQNVLTEHGWDSLEA